MRCEACRAAREPGDLIAFWPVGQTDRILYVCRPTCPAGEAMRFGPCFALQVGPANVHEIALVKPLPVALPDPVRPSTPGWFELMRLAGVRAA